MRLHDGLRTIGATFSKQSMLAEGRSLPAERTEAGHVLVSTPDGRERLVLRSDGGLSGVSGFGRTGKTRAITGEHDCARSMQVVEPANLIAKQ